MITKTFLKSQPSLNYFFMLNVSKLVNVLCINKNILV